MTVTNFRFANNIAYQINVNYFVKHKSYIIDLTISDLTVQKGNKSATARKTYQQFYFFCL